MNKGMLTVGIILLSIISLLMINVLSNYSTGGELDYYLVKETTDAAMTDAMDDEYYRLNGTIRMDKEKFVESFLRRFADSVDNTREYDIKFYALNEVPPKVSIKVDSLTVLSVKGDAAQITTKIDAIAESNYTQDQLTTKALQDANDDTGKAVEARSDSN